MKKSNKINSELFTSILYIVVGILLAVFPGEALSIAMTIIGAVFIISGVLELVKKNWTAGAISLVIGIAVIVLGWVFVEIVCIVLGVLIAIKGVLALVDALKKKKKNALDIVFPVITIVLGILLAFGNMLTILLVIGGILLAIDGVIGLVSQIVKK